MRIGIIAPPYAPIMDYIDYGGAELFIKRFCLLLSESGHDVTLFASRDSFVNGIKIHTHREISKNVIRSVSIGSSISENRNDEVNCFQDYKIDPREFDIIHCDWMNWFSVSALSSTNTVFRTHSSNVSPFLFNALDGRCVNIVNNSKFSKSCFRMCIGVGPVIYNSIREGDILAAENKLNYAIWSGRIIKYKGLLEAIHISEEINIPLMIAGRIQDNLYWEEVKPYLGERVKYLGFLSRRELLLYISRAKFLLQTSLVNESFGNVTLESLACGTPVMAFDSGATKEIVTPDVGIVSGNRMELVRSADRIMSIPSCTCIARAKEFNEPKMLSQYIDYFTSIQ